MTRRRALAGLASAGLIAGCGGAADRLSAPHDPVSTQAVDHRPWQLFLDRNSFDRGDGVTLVAYAAVAVADIELLDDYLAHLAAVPLDRLDRAEQLAFWLNLWNARVVRLVLDNLIVSSPDQIDAGGVFDTGPWRAPIVRVADARLSLVEVRRSVLAPLYRDPRWHYGLCDATLGAPSLPRRAFQGGSIDRSLEDAAIAYVNHPRAVRVDGEGQVLNELWRRNLADFGGTVAGVIANVRTYADRPLRVALDPAAPVRWIDDRRLNDGSV